VIAAEPDPIAMVRALVPPSAGNVAMIMLDMGELSTDLAITYGDAPRLVRSIPTGVSSLVKAAMQNLNVQEDQARQFILKFGLAPDRLDGQVLRALGTTLDGFVAEITKSIKFFQTRYPNVSISAMLLSDFSAIIPMLSDYLGSRTGVQTVVANPWQNVRISASDQQQLAAVASEFTTVVGLAKRKG
jgi:Tfp pilus assembly PilM family ATPase